MGARTAREVADELGMMAELCLSAKAYHPATRRMWQDRGAAFLIARDMIAALPTPTTGDSDE